MCCLREIYFRANDPYRLKARGKKKVFHASRNDKKMGVAILLSDKIDFGAKSITKDKDGHYKMIKG